MNMQVTQPAFQSKRTKPIDATGEGNLSADVKTPEVEQAPLVQVEAHPQAEAEQPVQPDVQVHTEAQVHVPETAAAPNATPAQAISKVLIVSASPELSNRVAGALAEDSDNLAVSFETSSIQSLAQGKAALLIDYNFVVFEIDTANESEMDALCDLRKCIPSGTRFLAVTAEPVTLANARLLMDAGVEEVLPLAQVREPVVEAPVSTGSDVSKNGLIVAVSQTRGGLGGTTMALNLAALLSRPHENVRPRVAVIDFDYQNGKVGATIDVDPNDAFLDLLKGTRKVDALFVETAMVSYLDAFDVLPAPIEFAPLEALTEATVAALLKELRAQYDYVILDMPKAIVSWMEAILAQADEILLLTNTSVSCVRQARRLIDLYRDEHVGLPIRLVVSQEKRPFRLSDAQKEATDFLGMEFEDWLPRDDRSAQLAASMGQPMVDCAKRSKLAKPLAQIVNHLKEMQAQPVRRLA